MRSVQRRSPAAAGDFKFDIISCLWYYSISYEEDIQEILLLFLALQRLFSDLIGFCIAFKHIGSFAAVFVSLFGESPRDFEWTYARDRVDHFFCKQDGACGRG